MTGPTSAQDGTTWRYLCSEGHLVVAQYPRTWCPYVRPYRDGSMCGARLVQHDQVLEDEPGPPPAA